MRGMFCGSDDYLIKRSIYIDSERIYGFNKWYSNIAFPGREGRIGTVEKLIPLVCRTKKNEILTFNIRSSVVRIFPNIIS